MNPSTRGWIAGTGCGCLTFFATFPLTIALVVGLAWFTWETGIQDLIGGGTSMGIGAVLGMILGVVLGLVVLLVVRKLAGGKPEE